MPQAWCEPCAARGRRTAATRLVPEFGRRVPKCDPCWKHNVPVALSENEKTAQPEAKKPEASMTAKVDWTQVQHDRDAGSSVPALAKTYGVSQPTVYAHTTGESRRGQRPKKDSPAKRRGRPPARARIAKAARSAGEDPLIEFVSLDEIPGRNVIDPVYGALAEELLRCPKGQAMKLAVPARAAAAKNPQGAIRQAIARGLQAAKKHVSFFVRVRDGVAYVWLA